MFCKNILSIHYYLGHAILASGVLCIHYWADMKKLSCSKARVAKMKMVLKIFKEFEKCDISNNIFYLRISYITLYKISQSFLKCSYQNTVIIMSLIGINSANPAYIEMLITIQ